MNELSKLYFIIKYGMWLSGLAADYNKKTGEASGFII